MSEADYNTLLKKINDTVKKVKSLEDGINSRPSADDHTKCSGFANDMQDYERENSSLSLWPSKETSGSPAARRSVASALRDLQQAIDGCTKTIEIMSE